MLPCSTFVINASETVRDILLNQLDTVNIASGQSEVTCESPGGEKMDKTIPE